MQQIQQKGHKQSQSSKQSSSSEDEIVIAFKPKKQQKYTKYTKTQPLQLDSQSEQYLQYFKDVENEVNEYNPVFNDISITQGDFQSKIKIISLKHSYHYQIVNLELKVGKYTSKVRILNIDQFSIFHKCKTIGFGAFGNVYRIKGVPGLNRYLQNYAIKCCKINQSAQPYKLMTVLKQFIMLRIANAAGNQCTPIQVSPFSFDVYYFKDCIEFVMDYCFWNDQPLSTFQNDLKIELRLMHRLNMVHCDIKLPNTAYNPIIKKWVFLDFGLAKILQQNFNQKTKTTFCGSLDHCCQQMLTLSKQKGKVGEVNLYYNDLFGLKTTLLQFQKQKQKKINKKIFDQGNRCDHQADTLLSEIAVFLSLNKIKLAIYGNYYAQFEDLLSTLRKLPFHLRFNLATFLYEVPITFKLKCFFDNLGTDITGIPQFSELHSFFDRGVSICMQEPKYQKKLQTLQLRYLKINKTTELHVHCQLNAEDISSLLVDKSRIVKLQPETYYSYLISFLSFNNNVYRKSVSQKIQVCRVFELVFLGKLQVAKSIATFQRTIIFLLNYCLTPPYNSWKCLNLNPIFITCSLLGLSTTQTIIRIFTVIPQISQDYLTCLIIFQLARQNLQWIYNFIHPADRASQQLYQIQQYMIEIQEQIMANLRNQLYFSSAQDKRQILLEIIQNIYHFRKVKSCLTINTLRQYEYLLDINLNKFIDNFNIRRVQSQFMYQTLLTLYIHSLLKFFSFGGSPVRVRRLYDRLMSHEKGKKQIEYYHFTMLKFYIRMNNNLQGQKLLNALMQKINEVQISHKCIFYHIFRIKKVDFNQQQLMLLMTTLGCEQYSFALGATQIINILKQVTIPIPSYNLLKEQAEHYTKSYYEYDYNSVKINISQKVASLSDLVKIYYNNVLHLFLLLQKWMNQLVESQLIPSFIWYLCLADQRLVPFHHNIKYLSFNIFLQNQDREQYHKQIQQHQLNVDITTAINRKQLFFQQIKQYHYNQYFVDYIQHQLCGFRPDSCQICQERCNALAILNDNIVIILSLLTETINKHVFNRFQFQPILLEMEDFNRLGGQVLYSYMKYISLYCIYLYSKELNNYETVLRQFYTLVRLTGQFQYFRLFFDTACFRGPQIFYKLIDIAYKDKQVKLSQRKKRIFELFQYFFSIMQSQNKKITLLHLCDLIFAIKKLYSQQQYIQLINWFIKLNPMAFKVNTQTSRMFNNGAKCSLLSAILFQQINNPIVGRVLAAMCKQLQLLYFSDYIEFICFYFFSVLYHRRKTMNLYYSRRDKLTLKQFIRVLGINDKGDSLLCSRNLKMQVVSFHARYYTELLKCQKNNNIRNILLSKFKKAHPHFTSICPKKGLRQ